MSKPIGDDRYVRIKGRLYESPDLDSYTSPQLRRGMTEDELFEAHKPARDPGEPISRGRTPEKENER